MPACPNLRPWRAVVSVVVLLGCGKSSAPTSPPPGGSGSSSFTASIDGTGWASLPSALVVLGAPNGTFSIGGGSSGGTGMAIMLANIAGPGTYPLGVGPGVPGGSASVTNGASAWATALSGNAGSITLTTVSATRLVGTFSYTAATATGGSGARSVTNGAIDVAVTSAGNIAMAPNAGSRFTCTIGGSSWTAATVALTGLPANGTLAMTVANTTYQLVVSLPGFTGVGTYALGAGQRYMTATSTSPVNTWGGLGAGSSGSFVVTRSDAARVTGTFDVTLAPGPLSPGPSPVRLVGTFDVGIP